MKEIFLSASVPKPGRGDFDWTADPFLIQFAVRELITVCLGRRRVIWGGHPSITPMVRAVCLDFGLEFDAPVVLYQSSFFDGQFPLENSYFQTVIIEGVKGDLESSLKILRHAMLSRPVEAAVFIGGMEGIFEEYEIYQHKHPDDANILAVGAPGGAARKLADSGSPDFDRIDFARLFHERLRIDPTEPRHEMTPSVVSRPPLIR